MPFGNVIHSCLEKDPERRYPSVTDVRDELVQLSKQVETGAAGDPAPAHEVDSGAIDPEALTIDSGHPVTGARPASMPVTGHSKKHWIGVAVAVLVLMALGI